jgi:hypothetical protein
MNISFASMSLRTLTFSGFPLLGTPVPDLPTRFLMGMNAENSRAFGYLAATQRSM